MIAVDENTNHPSERLYDVDSLAFPMVISVGTRKTRFEGFIARDALTEEVMVPWHDRWSGKTPVMGNMLVYDKAECGIESNESDFMSMSVPEKLCAIRKREMWRVHDDEPFTEIELLEGSP